MQLCMKREAVMCSAAANRFIKTMFSFCILQVMAKFEGLFIFRMVKIYQIS